VAPQSRKDRIQELRTLLKKYNEEYYLKDSPTVPDSEYDALMRELRRLEEEEGAPVPKDSPTRKVGGGVSEKFKTYHHNPPMLSLDNAFTPDELIKFDERVSKNLESKKPEYITELKIDGLGVNLIYENGGLIKGLTRGDGKTGEDVTENIKTIGSIPQKIEWPENWGHAEIRGEIYMKTSDFIALNQQRIKDGDEPFANPRNASAGSVRLLDANITAERKLNFLAYSLFVFDKNKKSLEAEGVKTQYELMMFLKKTGFTVNEPFEKHQDIGSVLENIAMQDERRKGLDFETDGVVIKVNSLSAQRELGSTSKFPRWAIAWKFKAEEAETVIRNIVIQVGRTGRLTPVAELEPVFLSGSTISRATLHNEDELRKKDVRIGDTVIIEKAGEIIPQVIRVIKEKRKSGSSEFNMPQTCPSCGLRAKREAGEAAWYCPNRNCPDQIRESIIHFASKGGLDIDGLGPALIEQFISNGMVKDVADIFALDFTKVAELEKMGGKSAENLRAAIEEAKGRGMQRVLMALGIKHVGARASLLLSRNFTAMEKLMRATREEMVKIYEIGDEVAGSVIAFFAEAKNRDLIQKLGERGVSLESQHESPDIQLFEGKNFVLTGTLENYSRDKAKELITRAGGRVTGTVSKKTDYLLAGEEPGSKYDRAKELGVRIISEKEFKEMLEGESKPGGTQIGLPIV